jgi:hypothetical protein
MEGEAGAFLGGGAALRAINLDVINRKAAPPS